MECVQNVEVQYSWSALMCCTPWRDFLQMAKLRKKKKNSKVGLRGSSPVTLSFTQNMSFTTAAQAPSTCVLMGGRAARENVFQESHKRPFNTAAPSIQPSSRLKGALWMCLDAEEKWGMWYTNHRSVSDAKVQNLPAAAAPGGVTWKHLQAKLKFNEMAAVSLVSPPPEADFPAAPQNVHELTQHRQVTPSWRILDHINLANRAEVG